MAIADGNTRRCTAGEWDHFSWMCSHGMVFEVLDWIDAGKPTLRAEGKNTSGFKYAIQSGNHSLVKLLWERAWQEPREAVLAVRYVTGSGSNEVFRYLVEAGCPLDHITAYDLFETHDLDLIRAGLDRGIDIRGPDGFADALLRFSSRPLIRFYMEDREKRPELVAEAGEALLTAIRESKVRAVALLVWAGVDPFTDLPDGHGEVDPDDPYYPVFELVSSERVEEILPLLRLKPTVDQWFYLMRDVGADRPELLDDLYRLRPDGRCLIEDDPERAAGLLDRLLHGTLSTHQWRDYDTYAAEVWCTKLIAWGVPFMSGDSSDIARWRRDAYRFGLEPGLARLLRKAWESGGPEQRARLLEFADKPKMKEWLESQARVLYRRMRFDVEEKTGGRPGTRSRWVHRAYKRGIPRRPVPEGALVLTRERIHRDVWKKPAMKVAERYGISSSMLARICTILGVPRPGRGHWAKSEKAREKGFVPLPELVEGQEEKWVVDPKMRQVQMGGGREKASIAPHLSAERAVSLPGVEMVLVLVWRRWAAREGPG